MDLPPTNKSKVVRNQIDFNLINQRIRNSVKCAKIYPAANINSDQNPVVAEIYSTIKSIKKKATIKLDMQQLFRDTPRA